MNTTIDIEPSKSKNKGFTLIELLIVIVILGILAAVTVFAVRGITDKGKTSACSADKKTLEVAAEAYMANNGSYPADMATMVSAGLLRSESSKWDYAKTAATTTAPESYALTAADDSGCTT